MNRLFKNKKGSIITGDIVIDIIIFFIALISFQVLSFKFNILNIPPYAWVLFDVVLLAISIVFARGILQEMKRANDPDVIKLRSENPHLKYVGETAIVVETLKPAGKIQLNTFHGEMIYDARASQLKDIPQGVRVKITGFELHEYLVRPLTNEEKNVEEFVSDELGVHPQDTNPIYTRKCTVSLETGDKLTGYFETDEIILSADFSNSDITIHKKDLHLIGSLPEKKFKVDTRDKNSFSGILKTQEIKIKNDHGDFSIPILKIEKVEFRP